MITLVLFPPAMGTASTDAMEKLMGTTTVDGVPYNIDQWDG